MIRTAVAVVGITTLFSGAAAAVTDAEFEALQNQLNTLADRVESCTTSSDTQVGGYGELQYHNLSDGPNPQDKGIDFHRFVIYMNHQFNNDIRFFSELEVEHSFIEGGGGGAVELEQAYVQFDLNDTTQLNVGQFLLPIGIINETHEPATFYGVQRNPVEHDIIPATWWEGGAMLSGHNASGFSYDIAVHSGLAVDKTTVIIRDGRKNVGDAPANNWAVTGRVKYTGIAGLELAGSVQLQDDLTQDSHTDNVDGATLIETHAIWNTGPVTLKALYASWSIDGAGASAIQMDSQKGGYIEASYKLNEAHGVFVRQNQWDNGGTGDTRKTQTDVGYNYWPHEDVVIKFDVQAQNAVAGDSDGINVGIGYQF